MGTKSASTVEAIQALYEEVDKLKTNPITDDEIKRAKDSILNSFVFNFDSPDKVLRERMAYEFYGYPADFLESFQAGVEKVTAADVARVATKYVHKDQLAVLVVGNPPEFDKPLSTLGAVKNWTSPSRRLRARRKRPLPSPLPLTRRAKRWPPNLSRPWAGRQNAIGEGDASDP